MRVDGLDLVEPGYAGEPWSEAEALGSAVWLWMHSASHRDAPLHTLNALLLPALKSRQFVLALENGRPVSYVSWACLDEDAERRYLGNPAVCMRAEDWASGQRLWILDWVAPFGHSAAMRRILERRQLANHCFRALYHRGERGLRVKTFKGIGMRVEEARAWFAAHPVARD